MKKIGVIINPNAKKFRTGKVDIKIYSDLSSDSINICTPQNLNELNLTVKDFMKRDLDIICIGGGDGTIHVVLSELINIYKKKSLPPILILKEGTMDNIARSVGLKGKGAALLRRLIKAINDGKSIEYEIRHTMKIGDKYCFLFGTGFVTNFLNKAYSGREKGLYRNMQVALMGVKEGLLNSNNGEIFSSAKQDIFINNKQISISNVSGILAGTVEHIGMGFSPLANSVHSENIFQIIILGISPRKILLNLNRLRTGENIKSDNYLNTLSRSLTIKQKGSFEYTMDGDIYTANDELNVTVGPSLKLIKI